MRIVNAMFGTGSGGIEQAFIDYCNALTLAGHQVLAMVHPDAEIMDKLDATGVEYVTRKNRGKWDLFAVRHLRRHLHQWQPDIMIAHGNRAISLLRQCHYAALLTGVCHNYKFKQLLKCDALISVSQDMCHKVIEAGFPASKIQVVPNMIQLPEIPPKPELVSHTNEDKVIGVAGRFVAKKGIDIFIRAVGILKGRNVPFHAIIAGAGEEDARLRKLASDLGLNDKIRFVGWIEEKADFYTQIDLFCVPSLHEPFGIVVLEGFSYGLPVVSSDSEGPTEIITDGLNGLIVPKSDPVALADALEKLLLNPELAQKIGSSGLDEVKSSYALPVVSARLNEVLTHLPRAGT